MISAAWFALLRGPQVSTISGAGPAGDFPVPLVDGEGRGVWHRRRSGRRIDLTVEPQSSASRWSGRARDGGPARAGNNYFPTKMGW
ncbi:hypothetical protein E1295_32880 [Nonomuraea mesophila]|uniref:Uncharacterized protein n=1 Tax=Nonomuraea mesophila TaxID=2530382 RepID=A0A4R5EWT2_9ACTN|nr:hypothetical protein E1295_32880 [Nonomuraea mesophila]